LDWHPLNKGKAMRIVLGLLCIGFLSCTSSHVKITAPAPTAPYEERREAYENLKPKTTFEFIGFDKYTMTTNRSTVGIVLPDNRVVQRAEDLLPAVSPDSETALYAKRGVALQTRARRIFLSIPLTAGLGFVGGTLAFRLVEEQPQGPTLSDFKIAGGVGLGILTLIASTIPAVHATMVREKSFLSYEQDLQAYLHLCKVDDAITECMTPALLPDSAFLPEPPASMPLPSSAPVSTF
jgi:hypothetical protein